MGSAGMNKNNQYSWLIVVEGYTDVSTYTRLLKKYTVLHKFYICKAHGKGNVLNMNNWDNIFPNSDNETVDLFRTLQNDLGRTNFEGVLLVVDADDSAQNTFITYKRHVNFDYIGNSQRKIKNDDVFWYLDTLCGTKEIPILGISVPMTESGCLETDLLSSSGFPKEGQKEYATLVEIIQKTSNIWNVPKRNDGKDWWIENKKAKLDKFIYSALSCGFDVCRLTPMMPEEPDVISHIKSAIASRISPAKRHM
jgi:hypothetical protein